MDPATAASSGNLILFALVVAGALIVVLGGVLVWMLKDRARAIQDRWALLDKRLAGGSETMAALQAGIADLRREIVDLAGRSVTEIDCRTCQDGARAEVRDLERRITGWESSQASLARDMAGLSDRVDQGFKTITGLLGQIVTIPRGPDDGASHG